MAVWMEYIFFKAHNKKALHGAEAMTQSVEDLLCKHEDLSPISQNPCQKS